MVDHTTRTRIARGQATEGAQNEQKPPCYDTPGSESHGFSPARQDTSELESDFLGKTALDNMIGSILTLRANYSTHRDLVMGLVPVILKTSEDLQVDFDHAGLSFRSFREGLSLLRPASEYICAILLDTLPLDMGHASAAVGLLAEALGGTLVKGKIAACARLLAEALSVKTGEGKIVARSLLNSCSRSLTLQLTLCSGLTAALYTLYSNSLNGGVAEAASTVAASSVAGLSAGAIFSDAHPDNTLKRLTRSVIDILMTSTFHSIPSSGYQTPSVFKDEEEVAVVQSVT